MRCELSLQPLSAIQPFPESRPLLEAVQAGSNVWDEGAEPTDRSHGEQPGVFGPVADGRLQTRL